MRQWSEMLVSHVVAETARCDILGPVHKPDTSLPKGRRGTHCVDNCNCPRFWFSGAGSSGRFTDLRHLWVFLPVFMVSAPSGMVLGKVLYVAIDGTYGNCIPSHGTDSHREWPTSTIHNRRMGVLATGRYGHTPTSGTRSSPGPRPRDEVRSRLHRRLSSSISVRGVRPGPAPPRSGSYLRRSPALTRRRA